VPAQIVLGDMHGLNTLEHQPAKIAAIEARWDTARPAPLTLFALPDEAAETNHYAIDIPVLGSLILTHDLNGEVKGLKDFPPEDRPPVIPPFFGFRIMVGIGFAMLGMAVLGWIQRWRGKLFAENWYLMLCQLACPLGFVAVIAGWVVTESGRQPWTVYGLMRTADSVSPALTGADVGLSLALYMLVYLIMYSTGFGYMLGLVRTGPEPQVIEAPVHGSRTPDPFHKQPLN
jgi:cytochrome bd ubiquinol oxidase subunit I